MTNIHYFEGYYGRHKEKIKKSDKNSSDKNNKMVRFTFRVDSNLAEKIRAKCLEKGKDFSKLNRILWESYFTVEENNEWKKEVENW